MDVNFKLRQVLNYQQGNHSTGAGNKPLFSPFYGTALIDWGGGGHTVFGPSFSDCLTAKNLSVCHNF